MGKWRVVISLLMCAAAIAGARWHLSHMWPAPMYFKIHQPDTKLVDHGLVRCDYEIRDLLPFDDQYGDSANGPLQVAHFGTVIYKGTAPAPEWASGPLSRDDQVKAVIADIRPYSDPKLPEAQFAINPPEQEMWESHGILSVVQSSEGLRNITTYLNRLRLHRRVAYEADRWGTILAMIAICSLLMHWNFRRWNLRPRTQFRILFSLLIASAVITVARLHFEQMPPKPAYFRVQPIRDFTFQPSPKSTLKELYTCESKWNDLVATWEGGYDVGPSSIVEIYHYGKLVYDGWWPVPPWVDRGPSNQDSFDSFYSGIKQSVEHAKASSNQPEMEGADDFGGGPDGIGIEGSKNCVQAAADYLNHLRLKRYAICQADHWLTILLPIIVLLFLLRWNYRHWKMHRREARGLCRRCGYDLRGGHARCPECGGAVDKSPASKQTQPAVSA